MNKVTYTLIIVLIALVLVLNFTNRQRAAVDTPLGVVGNTPYKATTTNESWTPSLQYKVLQTGPGHLGSVVITGGTLAAALNFYDGTTTASHLLHPTTTIGIIRASTPAGSFDFNTAFTRGLIVEFPTAIGPASSTITWQ